VGSSHRLALAACASSTELAATSFREAPRALRARRRNGDPLAADGGLPLRLAFIGQLDWAAMLDYFAAHAIPGVEHVDGDTYRRTIVVDGYPGVLELRSGGRDHLGLCAHLPRWAGLVHIVQRARAIANLDLHVEEAQRLLGGDPMIGPLLRARPGLRPPGTWDAFEAGVHALLARGATVARAAQLSTRIVQRFGRRVPGLERLGLTHTFPSAAALATANLREVGVPRARAAAIAAFAPAIVEDDVRLDRSVSLDQLVASLSSLEGVGAEIANYIALRLGEADAFPAGELAASRTVLEHDEHLLEDLADRWRPWRALAITHLRRAAERHESEPRVTNAAA
jgi:AraC family transcriptional regulator, regulatory protein of adaptative response / DNA-3-methyladenine glycosylase II